MSSLGELDESGLENLDIEAVDDNAREDDNGPVADEAPIVKFVKQILIDAIRNGASDIHFEPYEKMYRIRYRTDGILFDVAKPPINRSRPACGATESYVADGYLRTPRATGRPHQDEAVEKPRHRFSRQQPANVVGRKNRTADSRPIQRQAGH